MSDEKEEVKEEVKEVITDTVTVSDIEPVPDAPNLSAMIQNLHILMDQARAIVARYNGKISNLIDLESKIEGRTNILIVLEKSLRGREEDCKRIEDIQGLHTEALAMQKKYNEGLIALNESRDNHNREYNGFKQQMIDERAQTQREASAVVAQRRNIDNEVSKRVRETLIKMGVIKEDVAVEETAK